MEFSVLSNNLKMPMMGFGVFQVTDKDVCKQSVLNAIRTGYRLIDTAAVYGNEDAVGEAVREAISEGLCTREELFITSKLWVQDMLNQDIAAAGIEASLKKSGLEYFDLYLLHQAMKWSTKTGHRVRVFSSIDFPIRLVVTHHYIRAVLVRCNIQRYSPLLRELHR